MKLKRAIIILLSCATLLSMASCGKSKTEGIEINRATKTGETIKKWIRPCCLTHLTGLRYPLREFRHFVSLQ